MASLKEIEELVNQAQDTIIAGNSEYAKQVYWGLIKGAIKNCNELTREKRSDLVLIIADHLNKLGLQGTLEAPVGSIDELMKRTPPSNPPVSWPPG